MAASQGKSRPVVHAAMPAASVAVMATAMGEWEQAPLPIAGLASRTAARDRTMRAHAVRNRPRVVARLLP
jgi:hypothetical protein